MSHSAYFSLREKRDFFKTCCGTALILSCSLLFCHAADSEVPGFRLRMGECEAMGSTMKRSFCQLVDAACSLWGGCGQPGGSRGSTGESCHRDCVLSVMLYGTAGSSTVGILSCLWCQEGRGSMSKLSVGVRDCREDRASSQTFPQPGECMAQGHHPTTALLHQLTCRFWSGFWPWILSTRAALKARVMAPGSASSPGRSSQVMLLPLLLSVL